MAQQVSTFPRQTKKAHAVEGHVNDGYISEEYESINENVSVLIGTEVWNSASGRAVCS
jgi:hypothetical protein